MNFYRFLSYLLMVGMAVLGVLLVSMLAQLAGGSTLTPEVRRGLLVLVLVVLLSLFVFLFLLCLDRAKQRLQAEKRLYQLAHGMDQNTRRRAEEELARRETQGERALKSICDVLVHRKFPRPCLQLPIKVTRRPDPCIYSQFYLMANGQPVTWDNPNVEILLGGVPQDTYNLQPATNYQMRVGIQNASPFFDALGTQVRINLLDFGIGTITSSPITLFTKDVPALTNFPGVPETFNWVSPSTAGHFCIQVLIVHPEDVNPANNEGWNNTIVQGVQPGERFRLLIPVWNPQRIPRKERHDNSWRRRLAEVAINVDSYVLNPTTLPTENLEMLFERRATIWETTVAPGRLTIQPGAQEPRYVEFGVSVPENVHSGIQTTFNLSATAGGWPIGGVTIHLVVQ